MEKKAVFEGWCRADAVYLRRYFRGIQREPARGSRRWQFGRSVVLVGRRSDVNANTNAFKLADPLSLFLLRGGHAGP